VRAIATKALDKKGRKRASIWTGKKKRRKNREKGKGQNACLLHWEAQK